MSRQRFLPTRRSIIGGLAAGFAGTWLLRPTAAQGRRTLALAAKPGVVALRPGEKDTPVWSIETPGLSGPLRFKRGEEVEVTLRNDLPLPIVLNWRGIDGVPAIEPLTMRAPVAPGGKDSLVLPLRHAGTMVCELVPMGDGPRLPSRVLPLILEEREPVSTDRDEVLLIEDWRLGADGTALAPGADAKGATKLYTVNGAARTDIAVRANGRLRFRFINASQRNVIALKIEKHEVRVMAIDGQPAEPFLAREGLLVLAPGSRIDVFIDATKPPGTISQIHLDDRTDARPVARLVYANGAPIRPAPLPAAPPLPSNGLPSRLDLRSALRVDVALGMGGEASSDWVTPADFTAAIPPAFKVKRGRAVVIALTNRANMTTVFHLHGHHFRLLDRLDDGWKPFWLDTLAIDPGQTQRIAFAAEHAGRWLMESAAADWTAPRLVRWFSVD